MNRYYNEGVNRVSPLSGVGVGQQFRQTCDIANNANSVNPSAKERPITETAKRFSFNGIFESKPTSDGSVASDSTSSPVVSPIVTLNHTIQSPTPVDNSVDIDVDEETRDDDNNRVVVKRGRKRKIKEVSDPLKLKLETKKRVLKVGTTEELAQKFNIEVNLSENRDQNSSNNRIITTIRTKRNHNVSEVDIDVNETESKSELIQRFLLSQSSNTSPVVSPAINSDTDLNYNSNVSNSEPNDHYFHRSYSSEQTSQPSAQHLDISSSNHRKTVSNDCVCDEINDILSQLPPIESADIVWSDDQNDDKSSDNDVISDDNREQCPEESIDLQTNDTDIDSNNCVINRNSKVKTNKHLTEYEVEKYCQQDWEFVNGTYDSETEFRPWNHMTTGLSYNGEVLHILPYVDVDVEHNSD